jgi:hypothetical protein
VSPLRNALAAHLGQVLTPEVAAAIEFAARPVVSDDTALKLNRWRHLIEPVISQDSPPVSWAELQNTPVDLYESENSVLLVLMSERAAFIWVAAGVLDEILSLFEQVKVDAKQAGCKQVSYVGRAGWLRSAGFKKLASYGAMEI